VIADYEDVAAINEQLEKMGHSIGIRLADDFFAKSGISTCRTFADSAELIAKVGFRMYLNVSAAVTKWSDDKRAYSIEFDDNPLAEFVELPDDIRSSLSFSNLLCGVIRGALDAVLIVVKCEFTRCALRGDPTNEIRVSLVEILHEMPPIEDD